MSYNFNVPVINKLIASDTSNYYIPNETQIGNSILINSNLSSQVANSLFYKLSSGVQFTQEFGGLLYIPGKRYKIGSIVYLNILINNLNTVIPVMCIKNTEEKDYCDIQPIDDIVKTDVGAVYFTTANIKLEYWQPINAASSYRSGSIKIPEFQSVATDDSQFKFIKLIDFNQYNEFVDCTFNLSITRDESSKLDAEIYVQALGSNNIEVFINNVLCTNYTFDSSNTIFNSNSVFKDIALLGCMLAVCEDKCLYLICCGIHSDVTDKNINITYRLKNGTISPVMIHLNTLSFTFINNLQNIIIPFKKGASNTFIDCGQIYSYFSNVNNDFMFKNGLYKLGSEQTINQFLYPSLQKVTGENKLYNVNYRYLIHGPSSRYISESLPNIKGSLALQSQGWGGGGGVSHYYTIQSPIRQKSKLFGGTENVHPDAFTYNDRIGINANLYNSVYQDNGKVRPDSTSVNYYIKLF